MVLFVKQQFDSARALQGMDHDKKYSFILFEIC